MQHKCDRPIQVERPGDIRPFLSLLDTLAQPAVGAAPLSEGGGAEDGSGAIGGVPASREVSAEIETLDGARDRLPAEAKERRHDVLSADRGWRVSARASQLRRIPDKERHAR